jgi:hypothetical protein
MYIALTLDRLRNYDIIGEINAVYFNIAQRRYKINGNSKHASLCQTAFKSNILCKFKKACELKRDSAFVDQRLWKMAREKHWRWNLYEDKRLCVGIKGMPSERNGIGIGHRRFKGKNDPKFTILDKLIGEDDTNYYRKIYKEYFEQ